MAIIQSGVSGTTLMTVDPTYAAARAALRPIEQLNTFSVSLQPSMPVSTAVNAVVANMRFVAGSAGQAQYVIIQRIAISAITTTGLTALQEIGLGVYVARGYSASEVNNTTGVVPSGNALKFRTSLPTSQFASSGQLAYSTANAAGMTGGTKVVDAVPLFVINNVGTAAVGQVWPLTTVYENIPGETPIVLGTNEGLTFQNMILFPAAGVVKFTINIEWTETASTSTTSY